MANEHDKIIEEAIEETHGINPEFLRQILDKAEKQGNYMSVQSVMALQDEIARARTKFPGNRFLLTALGEEYGELCQAVLQRKAKRSIQMEALQCACVAMRIFEEGDPAYDNLTEEESKK